MINILFRALTFSLLYTLVYSRFPFLKPWDHDNVNCIKRDGVKICFPRKDSYSVCQKGISLPEEQYRECIQRSEICDAPGKFPMRRNPSRYYICTLNERTGTFHKEVESCERGKVFDLRTLQCLSAEALTVSESIPDETNDFTPHCKRPGIIPDNHDCKSFYFCAESQFAALKFYCGPNMYFDDYQKTCTRTMTKSCLVRFRNAQNLKKSNARRHDELVQDILEGKSDDDDDSSDSENDLTDSEDSEYDDELNDSFLKPNGKFLENENSEGKPRSRVLRKLRKILRTLHTIKKFSPPRRCKKTNDEIIREYQDRKEQNEKNKALREEMDDGEDNIPFERLLFPTHGLLTRIFGPHQGKPDRRQWLRIKFKPGSHEKFNNALYDHSEYM